MEQVYWLSTSLDGESDTRTLLYRYGRFVYSGAVLTEPVAGLEYLPGVLQGIQAVQGQIPFIGEVEELDPDSPHMTSLRALGAAVDVIHHEVTAAEPELARMVAEGASWLEEEDAAVYFEFEAAPGFTLNGSDVVFAKSYREDVLMTIIWYGPAGRAYVSLSPAGGEEQALVDTLFPSIYGKRRGAALADFPTPPQFTADLVYNGELSVEAAAAQTRSAASDAKEEDACLLPTWRIFSKLSVWEASDAVPDPEDIARRDAAFLEAAAEALEEEERAAEAAARAATETLDLSGGSGYTQIYLLMRPSPEHSVKTSRNGLVPRTALFRFGDWVYAGTADFPVDALRLGDVPNVLPALQKQQGRLGFLSEATAVPVNHALTPVLRAFMAAVALLRQEMEASQDEVAALAEQSLNAWIDAEWAASFFELALAPGSIPDALASVELIAAKIYLHAGMGVVMHVVYFEGSMYCVLADAVEDLPLLDVAFPDVTARNRVVQVRTYTEAQAKALSARLGGAAVCPRPYCLRVWEGRRRGVAGVGFGAPDALQLAGSDAANKIRDKARQRAEAEVAAVAAASAAVSGPRSAPSTAAPAPAPAPAPALAPAAAETSAPAAAAPVRAAPAAAASVESKVAEQEEEEEDEDALYDVSGLRSSLTHAGASKPATTSAIAATAGVAPATSDSKEADAAAASGARTAKPLPTSLLSGISRAPHFLAPLSSSPAAVASSGVGMGYNRLSIAPGQLGNAEEESKMGEAPWDASGKPRSLPAK